MRPTRQALRVALEALSNEPSSQERDFALSAGWCELARLELEAGDDPSAALRAASTALQNLPPERARLPGEPRPPESLRARALVERSAARARGNDPEGCLADVARTLVELLRLHVDPQRADMRASLARVELARARALLELREPELSLEACAIARELLTDSPPEEGRRIFPEAGEIEVRAWLLAGEDEQAREVLEIVLDELEALEARDARPPAFSPIRASLLVLKGRIGVEGGAVQREALADAEAYLRAASAAGFDYPLRWAALELARARSLVQTHVAGARLAFAAARGRLEAPLGAGRSDLFVPLLRVYAAELASLPSESGEGEWVRLERVLRVACGALERGPITTAQRRAWQRLLTSPPAQTAIRTAPDPIRAAARELARLLGQPAPHPLVEDAETSAELAAAPTS